MTTDCATTRRRHRFAAILVAAALSAGCQAEQMPIGNGRTLFLTCSGEGAPTIVLKAGWAADHAAWGIVQKELARVTRTCSYDRAGTGHSGPGPLPRTPEAVATDLLQALSAAGVSGDLVVVGHSIGAVYARETERLASGRVAGLVLVDPTIEAMAPEGLAPFIASASACFQAFSSNPPPADAETSTRCRVRPSEQPLVTWSHRLSELEHLFPPARGSARRDGQGRVRVEVLTAGQGLDTPEGQWRAARHEALAKAYASGRHRVVAESGHMMMRDRPAAIIEATLALVSATRRQKLLP